jgi:sugar O-acyltransferase (sialic acid O-acetyltransferase NeuD family)
VTTDLIIVGCGGHGREMFGIVGAINEATDVPRWRVIGFVDDGPSETNLKLVGGLGVPYLGPVSSLADQPGTAHLVIGIGDPRIRRQVDERAKAHGLSGASLVHPTATIGSDSVWGEGFVAAAGVRVTTNISFGRHVHLNQNVTVGHDCVVEDHVTVNPLAAVSGGCHLESGVLVGTTAAVLQNLRVGRDATVGAGACVVREVPAALIVKGVPAR